jgi:hypothetical protein
VKHEGRTINPEIAPTAELLHVQILELHASGKAKAQSKSAAVAVSCWKQSDSETNDLLSLTRAAKILHSPESSQLHRGPSFVHRPMESGLRAAIDVDCTTLMGLDVISKAIY